MTYLSPKEQLAPEGAARDKQIADWKAKYGSKIVKCVRIDRSNFSDDEGEAVAYVKQPSIATMTVISKYGDEPMKALKIMLNDCVLACDDDFCQNEYMYLALSEKFGEVRKLMGSEVKNA